MKEPKRLGAASSNVLPAVGSGVSFQALSLSTVGVGLLVLLQDLNEKVYLRLAFSMKGERRKEVPEIGEVLNLFPAPGLLHIEKMLVSQLYPDMDLGGNKV